MYLCLDCIYTNFTDICIFFMPIFYSMDQVRDHLKDYLDRSCRVASGKQATIDQNLYLLIIQCLEVSKTESRLDGFRWGIWSLELRGGKEEHTCNIKNVFIL